MKKLIIAFIVLLLVFIGVVLKSNSDRAKREEALARQTELHNKKMAQLEAENKSKIGQARIEHDNKLETEINYGSNESTSKKTNLSNDELSARCKSMSELARIIMQKRQDGVPMSEIVEKVVNTTPQPLQEVLRITVISAYDKPRFNTPEIQQKTILDFENEAYLTCTKAIS